MTDFVRKPFGLGAKNNVLRVLRKIEGFMLKILYPNITGIGYGVRVLTRSDNPVPTGCFKRSSDTSVGIGGSTARDSHLAFNARSSSELYSLDTVQPSSLRVTNIVRI